MTNAIVMFATASLILAFSSSATPSPASSNNAALERIYLCHGIESSSGYPHGGSQGVHTKLVLVLTDDPTSVRIGGANQWIIDSGERIHEPTSSLPLMCSPPSWQDKHCNLVQNNTNPPTYHFNCSPGDWHPNRCNAAYVDDSLRINFFNQQDMTNKSLDFNQKTGKITYGGGGVDGGWGFSGVCSPY